MNPARASFGTRDSVTIHDVTLDRIQLHTTHVLDGYLADHIHRSEPLRSMHEDAWEFRRTCRGFGRASRQTLRCPTTWWQHLKLAARTRWPRLLGRLAVRFQEVTVDTGALVAGLNDTVADRSVGRHYVIPYTMPPTLRLYLDDPRRKDEP